ncbi:BspA family leucine-rich repeat surface protein [archaeon]|nr:MAG: BspA family leucine-rich repeat surface protein [archaeon]
MVTSMNELLKGKKELNGDISKWDIGSVTGMRTMFYGARDFNQPIESWDVSKVTSMGFMFSHVNAHVIF